MMLMILSKLFNFWAPVSPYVKIEIVIPCLLYGNDYNDKNSTIVRMLLLKESCFSIFFVVVVGLGMNVRNLM